MTISLHETGQMLFQPPNVSGWNYADWRGVLYPPGCPQRKWLARYAEEFDTVEL